MTTSARGRTARGDIWDLLSLRVLRAPLTMIPSTARRTPTGCPTGLAGEPRLGTETLVAGIIPRPDPRSGGCSCYELRRRDGTVRVSLYRRGRCGVLLGGLRTATGRGRGAADRVALGRPGERRFRSGQPQDRAWRAEPDGWR